MVDMSGATYKGEVAATPAVLAKGAHGMKIDVRFPGLDASEALRAHVVRRIHFQLSRFDGDVAAVMVRISDVNGPRGGADKRVHVTVRGPVLSPVTIDGLGPDPYAAADVALKRAARTVSRDLARVRAVRRPETALRRAS